MLESIGMGPEHLTLADRISCRANAAPSPTRPRPGGVGGDGRNRQLGEYLLLECRDASMPVASLQQA